MLVLTRYRGESIWIGENIQVTILGHSEKVTRLGIKAPEDVCIIREELKDIKPSHERHYITPIYST